MKRQQVLEILAANREKVKAFAVESLAIFGSVARDDATEASDVDVLVEFEKGKPVGLFAFVRLQRFLSGIMGCRVDLVTREALRYPYPDSGLTAAWSADNVCPKQKGQ
jgi:predicted nucleotidyltransferase